jgi:hypothetical protein
VFHVVIDLLSMSPDYRQIGRQSENPSKSSLSEWIDRRLMQMLPPVMQDLLRIAPVAGRILVSQQPGS